VPIDLLPSLVLAAQPDAVLLLSVVKPALLLATFIPYGWVVSSKLEADARYFHFNVVMWNSVFLATAAIPLAVALLVVVKPTPTWVFVVSIACFFVAFAGGAAVLTRCLLGGGSSRDNSKAPLDGDV